MRKVIITGHLGCDPEIKTTKNGSNYTTFRMANNEYGEENPSWFSVTVWDAGLQNFCKNLKKGGNVIVDGDYSDRIYVNRISQQAEIGRDIRANAIYFGASSAKKEDDGQPKVQTASTPKVTVNPAPAPAPMPVPSSLDASTANVPADDDLPF